MLPARRLLAQGAREVGHTGDDIAPHGIVDGWFRASATGHSKQKDYGAEHPAESGPPQNPANAPIAIDSGTFAPACTEIAAVIAATRWTVRYKPPTSPTRPAEVMVR